MASVIADNEKYVLLIPQGLALLLILIHVHQSPGEHSEYDGQEGCREDNDKSFHSVTNLRLQKSEHGKGETYVHRSVMQSLAPC